MSNRLSQSASPTSWWDGSNIHIRVYNLGKDGKIHESCWDKDSWYSGALSGKFSAISAPGATSWFVGGQVHIRATSLSAEKKTQEYCWDGGGSGWYLGALTNKFPGVYAATSTSWWDGSKIHIRVYALNDNGVIQEYCWDSGPEGWYLGALAAAKHSAASTPVATSWWDGARPHIRVYSQSADNKIHEYCWDTDHWYTGALDGKFTATSAPGATSWLSGGQIHIRVYVLGEDKKMQEYCWDKDSWYSGALSNKFTANCAPGATSWLVDEQVHIRVYSQDLSDNYQEHCWDADHWYVGAFKGT